MDTGAKILAVAICLALTGVVAFVVGIATYSGTGNNDLAVFSLFVLAVAGIINFGSTMIAIRSIVNKTPFRWWHPITFVATAVGVLGASFACSIAMI